MSLRLYGYDKCSTCRDARQFLAARGVAHEFIAIREQPPTVAELKRMLAAHGGEVRRLFNTSGLDYKALNMKERLPKLSLEEALALLAGKGNLVKRPFLLGPGVALVGFKPAEWEKAFGAAA